LLIPIYVKLFNCIFDSDKVPGIYLSGNSIPIFKNKGKSDDPKNILTNFDVELSMETF